FFIKIFHFFVGYVILSLTGNNKEKRITEIAKNGVKLTEIDRTEDGITVKMLLSDFEGLSDMQNLEIVKKGGLPVLFSRLWAKKGILIGLLTFIFVIAIGSQFIWEIEFDADKDINREQVLTALERAGLKIGTPKMRLKKPEEIKNIVLNNTDDVCWCWVYIKGTKAVVRLRKTVFPPEMLREDIPCDIIAMRNGIIKRVITQKGRCVVTENQAVTAGETVISGTFDFAEAAGYQVHSRGIVEAYTTHTKTGVYKQNYCYKTYTGRKQRFLTLKFYKWQIPLYIKKRERFGNYDSTERDFDLKIGKNIYIGIGASVKELKEYETQKEPISYETAVELARENLERDISYELLQPAKLISKSFDAEKEDDETVRVTVTMDFIEEIGTEKRIGEVNFIEPKNNQSAAGD
ncbi:MAG: sporulation protein YqfD, partial [Clostridia bacterium]|nr:sporulation protein YqfD [Clostridia bacterium]